MGILKSLKENDDVREILGAWCILASPVVTLAYLAIIEQSPNFPFLLCITWALLVGLFIAVPLLIVFGYPAVFLYRALECIFVSIYERVHQWVNRSALKGK